MSLKTKRHQKHREEEKQDLEVKDQGLKVSDIKDQARDVLNSTRDTIINNKLLLGITGACIGVAAYVFGTEHGRNLQSRIGETLRDSMGRVQEGATTGWNRVRDFVSDLREEEEVQPEKLRRVV